MSVDSDLIERLAQPHKRMAEANVQADIRGLLLSGALQLAEDQVVDVALEVQAGQGKRLDIEVGFTVIEVKKDLAVGSVFEDGVSQLAQYLHLRSEKLQTRYVGILTDGRDWHLFHLTSKGAPQEAASFRLGGPENAEQLVEWLSAVIATQRDVPPTPEQITLRFGSGSAAFASHTASLAELWQAHGREAGMKVKFALWAKLLFTAFGTHFDKQQKLFIEHTYLVIVAELVAHRILGIDILGLPAKDLLAGKAFTKAGVLGVVEPDFFDWVAEVVGGDRIVTSIARQVAQISWADTDNDLLKHLYESVINPEQRHSLGEYYTPDWLAEAIIDQVVTDPTNQRVLDPACGSGTFPFHAIRKVSDALAKAGVGNQEALDHITTHVLGVDVHPVSVTLARVTYLLALADRLAPGQERGPISVPIYLGDAMQWHIDLDIADDEGLTVATNEDARYLGRGTLSFQSSELFFPASMLNDPASFDRFVSALVDRSSEVSPGSAEADHRSDSIAKRFGVPESDQPRVRQTFSELARLNEAGRDHIWGYYVRNLARPMWLARPDQKVDCLVGNPPWLAYMFMAPNMQAVFEANTKQRGLWAGGRLAARQDLSTYFVVRSAELYLRKGGQFGFVMPWGVLSRPAAAGFRSGKWGSDRLFTNAQFNHGWDLDGIRPHIFPVPASVVTGTFQSDMDLGTAGLRATEAWSGNLAEAKTWASASAVITRRTITPKSTARVRSPYRSQFRQGAIIAPRALLSVEEVSTEEAWISNVLGTIQIRSRRTSNEKAPWKDLPSRGPQPIEDRFVFPVLSGASLLPCRLLNPGYSAVIPWDSQLGELMGLDTEGFDEFEHLAAWWEVSEDLWRNHGRSKGLSLVGQINYMGKMAAQLPIAPIRIVYSTSGTRLTAALVRDRTAICDNRLYWAPISSIREGHYLTAVLNSGFVQSLVEPLQSRGQFGPRDFHLLPFELPIPLYNRELPAHNQLAKLGAKAECQAAALTLDLSKSFQTCRRQVRAALQESGLSGTIDNAVKELLSGNGAG